MDDGNSKAKKESQLIFVFIYLFIYSYVHFVFKSMSSRYMCDFNEQVKKKNIIRLLETKTKTKEKYKTS